MKVIIAGSRDLKSTLPDIQAAVDASGFEVVEHVSGHALGVDVAGEVWAWKHEPRRIPTKTFIAHWTTHGKAAGPIRNRAMAEYADALIAIYRKGKLTPGTRNMISEARKRGLRIYEHVI